MIFKDYISEKRNTIRYVLGRYEKNPMIVVGINPSIATNEKNDNTITIIENIARQRGYDGFIMFNVYPLRATRIDNNFPYICDEDIISRNVQYFKEKINEGDKIVAVWGTHICDRDYFTKSLKYLDNAIKEAGAEWICLAKTKSGHPHHPTRLAYNKMTFESFDMDSYLNKGMI